MVALNQERLTPVLPPRELFHVCIINKLHTVFLVHFGINLHLCVFQKVEIALAEAARAISAFEKLTRSN